MILIVIDPDWFIHMPFSVSTPSSMTATEGSAAVFTTRSPEGLDGKKIALLDRDHSILAFNERVFDWAVRPDVPLLERLRYLCIVSSNLDEFFMVYAIFTKSEINCKNITLFFIINNLCKILSKTINID